MAQCDAWQGDSICLEISGGIADIAIRRPPLNILDIETLRELNRALSACHEDDVRVLLLHSGIDGTFSAGVDVRDHSADRLEAMLREVRENARLLLSLPGVSIAAVEAKALGGGAELALLCDLLILGEEAHLALPEISLAAFPPIAAALLPERMPWQTAMRLFLGSNVPAEAAFELGIASEVVSGQRAYDSARARARSIAGLSGIALRALIGATRHERAAAILARLDRAIELYMERLRPSHDAEEGIAAFIAKRPPAWSHR